MAHFTLHFLFRASFAVACKDSGEPLMNLAGMVFMACRGFLFPVAEFPKPNKCLHLFCYSMSSGTQKV